MESIYHIQPSCFSPCPHQISIINVSIRHWAEYGFKNLSQHSNPSRLCLSDLAWMTKSICHSCPYLFLFKTKEASLFLRWNLHLAPWSYSISLPWSSDSSEQSLGDIWEAVSWAQVLSKCAEWNIILNFQVVLFFQSISSKQEMWRPKLIQSQQGANHRIVFIWRLTLDAFWRKNWYSS